MIPNLLTLVQAAHLAAQLYKRLKKDSPEKRSEKLSELKQAIRNIDEKQSTKDLEKWISENF